VGDRVGLAPGFLTDMIDQQVAGNAVQITGGVVDLLLAATLGHAQKTFLHQVRGQLWVSHLARQIPAQGTGMLEEQALEIRIQQTDSLSMKERGRYLTFCRE